MNKRKRKRQKGGFGNTIFTDKEYYSLLKRREAWEKFKAKNRKRPKKGRKQKGSFLLQQIAKLFSG